MLLQICKLFQHCAFRVPKVRQALPGFSFGWYEIQKSVPTSSIAYVHTETHTLRETRKTDLQKKLFISFFVFLLLCMSTAGNLALLGVCKGADGSCKAFCWRRAVSSDHAFSTEVTQCEE